jgi:hypothetical protein
MIVLDTNVISEMMKPPSIRSPVVYAWLREQMPDQMYTTVLSLAEIMGGIEVLPEGRRKDGIRSGAERVFADMFPGRILLFDEAAARAYGSIIARQRKAGIAVSHFDIQIAAIAKTRGMAVATRDIDFGECEVPVVNPWGRHDL